MNEPNAIHPGISALYHHWCVASAVKVAVSASIDAPAEFMPEAAQFAQTFSAFLRLSVFYSLLFVVVEGYFALGENDPDIDALLADGERVRTLRRFRNANFHYQENPLSEKVLEYLEREDGPDWTRALDSAFERFFRSRLPIDQTVASLNRSKQTNQG